MKQLTPITMIKPLLAPIKKISSTSNGPIPLSSMFDINILKYRSILIMGLYETAWIQTFYNLKTRYTKEDFDIWCEHTIQNVK